MGFITENDFSRVKFIILNHLNFEAEFKSLGFVTFLQLLRCLGLVGFKLRSFGPENPMNRRFLYIRSKRKPSDGQLLVRPDERHDFS